MRNCEAIDEVLKRMSPAGRFAMPKPKLSAAIAPAWGEFSEGVYEMLP
ncbi:MAG: hypothetical protein II752_08685 [Muribaculaceae bacterium]|nr:hypothetical protein [Muribaculaceae bacterium]